VNGSLNIFFNDWVPHLILFFQIKRLPNRDAIHITNIQVATPTLPVSNAYPGPASAGASDTNIEPTRRDMNKPAIAAKIKTIRPRSRRILLPQIHCKYRIHPSNEIKMTSVVFPIHTTLEGAERIASRMGQKSIAQHQAEKVV
jgi:hypothetical protein